MKKFTILVFGIKITEKGYVKEEHIEKKAAQQKDKVK